MDAMFAGVLLAEGFYDVLRWKWLQHLSLADGYGGYGWDFERDYIYNAQAC